MRTSDPRLSTVALAVLTAVCWGVILFAPDSLFWDDWVMSGADVVDLYHDLGLPWVGYIAVALWALGPLAFKIVGVLCAIAVALAARGIAARGLGLGPTETWIAAALVATLPFNPGRASVAILSTYSISLAVFFFAWWLLVKAGPRGQVRAVLASILFFTSFTTASLLPFIAVPIAHLALLYFDSASGFWRQLLGFAGRYWFLLAAPVLFWLVRTAFLEPSGVYASYNSFIEWEWPPNDAIVGTVLVLLAAVGGAAILMVRVFVRGSRRGVDLATAIVAGSGALALSVVIWLGRGSTSIEAIVVTAIVAVSGLVVIATAAFAARDSELPARVGHSAFLAAAGLVAFALGALPYLLVGKLPQFVEWETRHQLLLPTGTALIAVAALVAATGFGTRGAVVARVGSIVAVGLSAVAVVIAGLGLMADWHKQVQIVDELRSLDEVAAASTVVVTDSTRSWNFAGRHYRFYEPIGWLQTAFSDDSRFAVEDTELAAVESGAYSTLLESGVRYGFADWDRTGPAVAIRIESLPGASWWDLLVGKPAIRVTATPTTLTLGS